MELYFILFYIHNEYVTLKYHIPCKFFMADIYTTLCNNQPLSDLPPYKKEAELALALVRAMSEENRTVFSLAQQQLNKWASKDMLAIPSSFKHRDVRAALSVAREIGFLPHQQQIILSQEFESDFARVWSLSAQLADLTLFDQLLPHALRLDITPLRCVQEIFDAKSDAIRWDLYNHLAQRNEIGRLKQLESHFNYLETSLLHEGFSPGEMMRTQLLFATKVICESIKNSSWETFEWLVNMAAVKPSSFLVNTVSGVCLRAPSVYLEKVFEMCSPHHFDLFSFFDDTDKSGKSTERLNDLLALVDRTNTECLEMLSSDLYPRNTTRRTAIAERAETLLQHARLSHAIEITDASHKKNKM